MQRPFSKRFLIYFLAMFVPGFALGLLMGLTIKVDDALPGTNPLIFVAQSLFCMVIISAVIALRASQRKSRDSRVVLAIMGIWCIFPLLTAAIAIRENILQTILGILLFCSIPVGYCLPVSRWLSKKERQVDSDALVNSITAEH